MTFLNILHSTSSYDVNIDMLAMEAGRNTFNPRPTLLIATKLLRNQQWFGRQLLTLPYIACNIELYLMLKICKHYLQYLIFLVIQDKVNIFTAKSFLF